MNTIASEANLRAVKVKMVKMPFVEEALAEYEGSSSDGDGLALEWCPRWEAFKFLKNKELKGLDSILKEGAYTRLRYFYITP
jgi:hypothetical protein